MRERLGIDSLEATWTCLLPTANSVSFTRLTSSRSAVSHGSALKHPPTVSVTVDQAWAEDWLDLGYAMTVHKSQGSDFFGVLLVLPAEGRQLLVSRELLYTALTRFTHKLYLLVQGSPGDLAVLERGAWQGSSEYFRRNTSLYHLREAVKEIDDYRPERRIHTTLLRELVASKSELLIANRLAELRVPYHYEFKLVAADGSIRRPDFTGADRNSRWPRRTVLGTLGNARQAGLRRIG